MNYYTNKIVKDKNNRGHKKMHYLKQISLVWVLCLFSTFAQAETFSEGEKYSKLKQTIPTQTGDKIEVLEFFWYGCPHCYSFEATLTKWKKTLPENVKFIRVPAPLNPRWMVHTKTFYALEIMGEGDKHHEALFKAIHVSKKKLFNKSSIADFLASQGVNKDDFLSNLDSFAVQMRARNAQKLGKQYQTNGVPMLAVNGTYSITGKQGGSYVGMTKVADHLIGLENK